MADAGSSVDVAKAIADPLAAFGALLKAATPEGPVQTALFLVLGLCVAAAPFVFRYYIGVLGQGAQPEGSVERKDYDALRASLTGGNLAARLYADRLTRFLDAVDRFFGDANVPGWSRGFAAAVAAFEGFAIWSVFWEEGRIVLRRFAHDLGIGATAGVYAIIALAAVAAAAALTFAFGSSGMGAAAFGIAVVAAVAAGGRVAGAVAVAAAVPTVLGLAFGLAGASQSDVASVVGAAAAASIGTLLLCAFAIKHQAQGVFLLFFIPAMILFCLALVGTLLPLRTWPYVGPLLLFQGLLTLINAPCNWASIGLTRALLRRGLELGGWWPYLLGVINAAFATVIVGLLALAMVLGVQAFDGLVSHGGGVPILPLGPLFDGIAEDPAAPEYWWIYALLLATMIPSLINLAIGGMAFTRGIPWLARLLLQWIPEGKAVPEYKRQPAAIGLTIQVFAGAFLGFAAQAFLLGRHFPCHALARREPAQHGPRDCRFRLSRADGKAVRRLLSAHVAVTSRPSCTFRGTPCVPCRAASARRLWPNIPWPWRTSAPSSSLARRARRGRPERQELRADSPAFAHNRLR
jgi:hypothetical protein